jgi:hypothetical protein
MNFDILAEWIQIYLCTDEPREKKWKRMHVKQIWLVPIYTVYYM